MIFNITDSTMQKKCKRISVLFATFRCFSTKYNEISGEMKFRVNFVEFSKRLLSHSKQKFTLLLEKPHEYSSEIALRIAKICLSI